MPIRRHLSQHDRAEALPLITDEAVVTHASAMDRNRTSEVQATALSLLEAHGRSAWLDRVVEPPGAGRDDADVDWERLTELVAEADVSPTLETQLATLRERFERPYPSLLRIRLDPDTDIGFAPGQYVTLRYQGVPRPYSIASAPGDDEIEVCVRRVPGGRLTAELATDVAVGQEAVLRGPYGEFVLEEPSERDLVFLATGTGVAPLKSMIDYTFATGRDRVDDARRDVWLVLGTSWEDDLPYREAFRDLDDERENFHFVPTLSREPYLTDWGGETAYVQYTFLKYLAEGAVDGSALPAGMAAYLDQEPRTDVEARLEPGSTEVYAVGIGAMVTRLVRAARAVGVPEEHVHAESYG